MNSMYKAMVEKYGIIIVNGKLYFSENSREEVEKNYDTYKTMKEKLSPDKPVLAIDDFVNDYMGGKYMARLIIEDDKIIKDCFSLTYEKAENAVKATIDAFYDSNFDPSINYLDIYRKNIF